MRVIIAPDSFKGSISANDACSAIAAGWRSVRPGDEVVTLPQADGGEGTLDAIEAATPDAVRRSAGTVTGPDGRPLPGEWLELRDGTAIVELAQSSGLALMERLDPLGATTRGLGEVIAAALDAGAHALVIGLGGSASTDGGAGALEALGDRPAPPGGVTLLTDVTAPLLGPRGAAAVFGPQKGATPADIDALEERLHAWALRWDADPATPGAGAAGGTAFGFLASWGAKIRPGSAAIAKLTGLEGQLARADAFITGEGNFDATSLTGKVVGHALQLAERNGLVARTMVVAGRVTVEPHAPSGALVASISLVDLAGSTDAALAEPARWLTAAGARAATQLDA
ncbi:MAG TPA: glycerate kinase [Pseudolysinimonas sp.]|nr:glycerate kinase [Pseudolysinimonas sp.]